MGARNMISPIQNQINTIFVHVRDLERSVKWYSQLLGQDYDLANVAGPVCNTKINHHTGLTLDASPAGVVKENLASSYPLFNFHTNHIEESYAFVTQMGYQIESDIIRFETLAYFTIRDPDGNVVMICTD